MPASLPSASGTIMRLHIPPSAVMSSSVDRLLRFCRRRNDSSSYRTMMRMIANDIDDDDDRIRRIGLQCVYFIAFSRRSSLIAQNVA